MKPTTQPFLLRWALHFLNDLSAADVEAVSCLCCMGPRGLREDVICFNASISSCEKAGQWIVALSLLQRMLDTDLLPNQSPGVHLPHLPAEGQLRCCSGRLRSSVPSVRELVTRCERLLRRGGDVEMALRR